MSNVPTIELGAGTYALSSNDLQINKAMTIQGAGMAGAPSGTTIQQTDGTNLVIDAEAPSGTVTLENLEVIGGHNTTTGFPAGYSDGGGIYNGDTLVLDSVLVTGNTVIGAQGDDGSGGGVYDGSSATLTLNNSAVAMNHADGGPGPLGVMGAQVAPAAVAESTSARTRR